MFEYYNNTLCVQAGWLYGSAEIVTMNNYRNLVRRNKLSVLRRGCKGTPALIEFDTIPSKFKQVIITKFGNPHKTTKNTKFKDYLKNDLNAVKFFSDFTLENGDSLPQKNIKEYVANAVVLNAVHEIAVKTTQRRNALGGKTSDLWNKMSDIIQDLPRNSYPHNLPDNVRRLKEKYRLYKNESYYSLIHKGFCNKNSEKITSDAKRWLLSRWADRVDRIATIKQLFDEYNVLAKIEGWKELHEVQSIHNYLHSEEIVHLWYGHRFGELKSKEKFAYQHSTKMPTMRDSLWYSDGTKLNYYYLDDNGKISTCQVYEVMDAYSEMFIGYHISKTEDYVAQHQAFKMAAQVSGHRPYELRFDNQGGHSKLEAGDLFANLARLSIKTMPYNGKSKTIESAFGRFQQQYLARDWYFTGQNITAKSDESKENSEFTAANTKNFPTLSEIKKQYALRRKEWNSAPHHLTGRPRIEMYFESVNPETPEIQLWEMIDLFWIQRAKPVMLTSYGLQFTEKKIKHTFMLHDENGLPDLTWMRENIDRKFTIKFDPDDMSMIHIYKDTPAGLRYVTPLTQKIEIHRGKQEQLEGESEFIKTVNDANKVERLRAADQMEDILDEFGATAEDYGLNTPSIKGVNSKRRKAVKSDRFGEVQKALSNAGSNEDSDDDLNIYQHM